MSKNKVNSIDHLIEKLTIEFAKIPNFQLTQSDPDANRLFNFVLNKFSEIQDFKTLYKRYFIPSINKSIVDTKNEIKHSVFRSLINLPENQLKGNYYDTIRLGYVGLFHKIENFVKDLISETNLLFNNNLLGEDSISQFYQVKYNFKFDNWYSDTCITKINWISNCTKHYDGYPKKIPKYKYLSYIPENVRININHDEFIGDIEYVANTFYYYKLSQILTLGIFKMASDELNNDDCSDEVKEKLSILESKLKIIMK